MEEDSGITALVVATRLSALCTMVTWILSWLAPELIRTSPAGSLFDIMFKGIAKRRRTMQYLTVAFVAVHVGCVCARTGFLITGWYSERLAHIWMVPKGSMSTYNTVVGLPAAALALLLIRNLVPGADSAFGTASAVLAFIVFAINYLENMFAVIARWEFDLHHVGAVAYYLFCSLVLLQAVMLFRIVRKKPTVERTTSEDSSSPEQHQKKQKGKKTKSE